MKVSIENLGLLRKAEFEVGDLTIICGKNNTGKTYATYALYGFLRLWQSELLSIEDSRTLCDDRSVSTLMRDGSVHISSEINFESIVERACTRYHTLLPRVFGTGQNKFPNATFSISSLSNSTHTQEIAFPNDESPLFHLEFDPIKRILNFKPDQNEPIPDIAIRKVLCEVICRTVFPNPFLASVERTGASIFQSELDLTRIGLMNALKNAKNLENELLLQRLFDISEYRPEYALPIERNISTIRSREVIFKRNGVLNQDILDFFQSIVGGSFIIDKDGYLYFLPSQKTKDRLALNDSSSSVRSLFLIDLYLRHLAQEGDILMIDEPELNLHPENQRLMARLIARLVKSGIKVFITTHSDYIVKELNTLIMLNYKPQMLKKDLGTPKYEESELLSVEKVKVYIAEQALISVEGQKRKVRDFTLTPAPIDPEYGVEVSSFDHSIDEMNRIQETIVFGDE